MVILGPGPNDSVYTRLLLDFPASIVYAIQFPRQRWFMVPGQYVSLDALARLTADGDSGISDVGDVHVAATNYSHTHCCPGSTGISTGSLGPKCCAEEDMGNNLTRPLEG